MDSLRVEITAAARAEGRRTAPVDLDVQSEQERARGGFSSQQLQARKNVYAGIGRHDDIVVGGKFGLSVNLHPSIPGWA